MTKVALKCSDGANSGFGYRLSSYGQYGMASNQTLVGKEKGVRLSIGPIALSIEC